MVKNSGTLLSIFNFIPAVIVFVLSLTTCWQLALHLSTHDHRFFHKREIENRESVLWLMCCDASLVVLFGCQHSFMARFKTTLFSGILQRTFYVSFTLIALQILMIFWQPVTSVTLWSFNTSSNSLIWWFFSLSHGLCWMTIYAGSLVLDFLELVGFKQVYYDIKGWPQPLQRKSRELQRLYSHMRHPGFTAFLVIMWCHPVMRLDRLLLALALPIYMALAFRVDLKDYHYNTYQLTRKKSELNQIF